MIKKEYSRKELTQAAINSLKERGVSLVDIAEIVLFLQYSYDEDLRIDKCVDVVKSVLGKREVAYAVLTGIELDKAVENGHISEPIGSIIKSDYKLYGIDEIIPLSIVNLYGSIAMTNFGHLDKLKHGIIGKLDSDGSKVNTFLDDLVAGIAAAGAASLAHGKCEIDNLDDE